ncbi:MAG: hypothetical protein ACOC7U_04395, partial [Spirochaetota bacterium]
YMPGYGWVDFDPTSFAIPPPGMGNPNAMDVVIPLISVEEMKPGFAIPWWMIGWGLALVLGASLVGVYVYRYGSQVYLRFLSVRKDRRAVKATYLLFLMDLAQNGYPLKPWSKTPVEYAKSYPELMPFSEVYTTLRYKEQYTPGQKEELMYRLKKDYHNTLASCRRKGLYHALRRVLSLKGIYYTW